MKKIIFSIALIMSGLCFFVQAQDNVQGQVKEDTVSQTIVNQTDDGFKEIKLEELNEKVQAAIKTYENEYTVKALAYNVEKKQTKVTLLSKTDQSEKVVLLNEDGTVVPKEDEVK